MVTLQKEVRNEIYIEAYCNAAFKVISHYIRGLAKNNKTTVNLALIEDDIVKLASVIVEEKDFSEDRLMIVAQKLYEQIRK